MDSANVPGLSLALIRDRQIQYSQGYGLTKADSTQPVGATTVFDAASLSKPVFAYAVMQLVEECLLDLDKPLFEYLPYPDVADDERYRQITARMVLSHRSGLPNWRKNRRSNQLSLVSNPGERFGYSGEGFVYLQKVVETITGQSLNELMKKRVFAPLGMTRSSYVWQPAFETDFAWSHDKLGPPEPKQKFTQPNVAYSLQTTADDYARFVRAMLTADGLRPATLDQMLSRQVQLPTRISGSDTLSSTLFWGLGIGLETTPAGDYLWHWGDNGTFKCFVAANRQRGDGVIYFTNSVNGLSILGEMLRATLGGTHPAVSFLNYKSYKTEPEPVRIKQSGHR